MAQAGAIDPVLHTPPARSKAARGKQSSNFAQALDEANTPSTAKTEKRAEAERSERPQSRKPVKDPHETKPQRKAEHERHRAQDTKSDVTSTRDDATIKDPAPSAPQDNKSVNTTEADVNAAPEATSADDDKKNDIKQNIGPDTPAEIPLPQVTTGPDTSETSLPPPQPAAPISQATPEPDGHHTEGDEVDFEISVTSLQSSKPVKTAHHADTPKSSHSDSEIDDAAEAFSEEKPAVAREHVKTNEPKTQNAETKPRQSDFSDNSASKTETPKPNSQQELGPQSATVSGSHHSHHHLGPDPVTTPSALPPNIPDATKPNPVPYHALPIEIGLRALDGAKEITLDLTPKELGQLNIRITIDDQSSIQVSIVTEKPQTLALLQHDVSHIRNALEQAGYSTQDNSLQFSLQNNMSSNSNSSRDEQRKPASHNASNSDLDGGEIEASTPIRQRIHLNQLDLSV